MLGTRGPFWPTLGSGAPSSKLSSIVMSHEDFRLTPPPHDLEHRCLCNLSVLADCPPGSWYWDMAFSWFSFQNVCSFSNKRPDLVITIFFPNVATPDGSGARRGPGSRRTPARRPQSCRAAACLPARTAFPPRPPSGRCRGTSANSARALLCPAACPAACPALGTRVSKTDSAGALWELTRGGGAGHAK